MAGYKARLERDLDRWIEGGLVPAENRTAILDTVAEGRRVDASVALAVVGALLLGVAAIAFIAANWAEIPRIARFALVIGVFLGAASGAAWAARAQRPILTNTLLTVAALIYAAAIGLTGQIFDIAGDPQRALRGAGLAAFALALAGRSSGAGVAGLVLLGVGEFTGRSSGDDETRWLIFAAPVGLAMAWFWNSKPLAHAGSLALLVGTVGVLALRDADWGTASLLIAGAIAAALALAARQLSDRQTAIVFMLWMVWGALAMFAAGGFDNLSTPERIAHRAVWLTAAVGTIALGMHDRQGMATAAGVVALIAGICTILFDLGLGLMTAAALFGACAVVALVAGFVVRGRRAKA